MDTDAMVSGATAALRRARSIGIDSREIARESGIAESHLSNIYHESYGMRPATAERLRDSIIRVLKRRQEQTQALLADLGCE